MKVLMIGWELPPHNCGGLGVACHFLASRLVGKGVELTFVLPQKKTFPDFCFSLLFARGSPTHGALLPAYAHQVAFRGGSGDLIFQVKAYGDQIRTLIENLDFDVIHAHDWLTFPAGIEAAGMSGRPLVVHVHITEFDKSGGGPINQRIYMIEKKGMEAARQVIANSAMTKKKIVELYQIDPGKISVVYNGVECEEWQGERFSLPLKTKRRKMVLFLGRLTMQKGPDWLLKAAKKVLSVDSNVLFVLAGKGDMLPQLIRQAGDMGITGNVFFAGWVSDQERKKLYQAADVYILPSLSEPFGITVLEAMAAGTPVIISRQTGVGEALNHVLRVDFWDTDQMAAKILAALKYKPLTQTLRQNGLSEAERFSWEAAADKCLAIYDQVISQDGF